MIRARQSCAAFVFLLLLSHAVHAQDGSFAHDGVQLFYRTMGSGGPAIMLSGGPGFNVDYMIPVGDFLPSTYQRVFYEQRGTGRSRLASITPENMDGSLPGMGFTAPGSSACAKNTTLAAGYRTPRITWFRLA